jgi:2-dehydropantoate 2-reductase
VRFLVFGTGAVGGLMGARLALAGHEVMFLARPSVVEELQQNGLTLIDDGQCRQLHSVHASSEFTDAFHAGQPDLILLCVKAYDCAEAANLIKRSQSESLPVLSLLNGINNEMTLAQTLGAHNVIPGTLTTAVQMTEPGVVTVERRRGVGIASGHPLTRKLAEQLRQAGFQTELYSNPDRMKWSKLLTNIVSNATSAITGLDPSDVFTHPGLARLEIDALRETVRVMRKLGFTPQNLPGVSVGVLGKAIFLPTILTRYVLGWIVARGRGRKKPSLHFDIGRGKSEVDWLNGAVVRHGEELGVPTPVNRILHQTMKALVEDGNLHKVFLGNPDALIEKVYASDNLQ